MRYAFRIWSHGNQWCWMDCTSEKLTGQCCCGRREHAYVTCPMHIQWKVRVKYLSLATSMKIKIVECTPNVRSTNSTTWALDCCSYTKPFQSPGWFSDYCSFASHFRWMVMSWLVCCFASLNCKDTEYCFIPKCFILLCNFVLDPSSMLFSLHYFLLRLLPDKPLR